MNPDEIQLNEYYRGIMNEAIGLPQFEIPIDIIFNGTGDYFTSAKLSGVKVQEKKIFPLYQIFEKLDSFIAEVKSIEDVKVIVGGSLGLLLQGYELDRPIGDLDILIECSKADRDWINKCLQSRYPILKSSDSNDFQLAIGFGGIKIDICFSTKVEYVNTTYNGKSYLANNYRNIIRYKMIYADNNDKHFDDIIKLIDKQPIKKVKFTTNV